MPFHILLETPVANRVARCLLCVLVIKRLKSNDSQDHCLRSRESCILLLSTASGITPISETHKLQVPTKFAAVTAR